MNRWLRGRLLLGLSAALIVSGCGESPQAPKSFSKNVGPPPVQAGKAKAKVRGQNQQVRSFTVPAQ
jgi:hypothetical protein